MGRKANTNTNTTKTRKSRKNEVIVMNDNVNENVQNETIEGVDQITDIEAVDQEINNKVLADVLASDKVQSELSLSLAYEKADTITEQHFLDVNTSDLSMVKEGLTRSVEAGSTLEYINCVLVNTMIKKTDSKEATKKLKEELADLLGYKTNYIEKMCRVADKFVTMSVPCNDVETITTKDGKETKTTLVKANYSTLLENITSAKVKPLSDKNGINFRVSAVMEFERLGADEAKKLIKSGTLKASMNNSAIRDVVDRIKGTGKYKDNGQTDGQTDGQTSGQTSGQTDSQTNEVKTDKERLSVAIKLLEGLTTKSIIEGNKYGEIMDCLNAWTEVVK